MADGDITQRGTRVATPKRGRVERIFYADAAGKWQIIESAILDPPKYKATKYIRSITSIRMGGRWKSTFASTSYIYGLEMLAVLTTLVEDGDELANRAATFYIDNNNALLVILKNSANPLSIRAMAGLIW